MRFSPIVYLFAASIMVWSWFDLPLGGYDWRMAFAPSVRHWMVEPWASGSLILPWGNIFLTPLATMPDHIATVITNGLTVFVFVLVARRFNAPEWLALILLVSPMGYFLFVNGQVDFLIWIGLLMFNGLDLIFLTIKPQIALGILIPRLRRAESRWLRYLAPLTILTLFSVFIWGTWFIIFPTLKASTIANYSIFPWGVPIGLVLLGFSWRYPDDRWGIAATPFLVPYINIQSYLAMCLALASFKPRLTLAIWLVLWIYGFALIILPHLKST
jgi:hypothetical protein